MKKEMKKQEGHHKKILLRVILWFSILYLLTLGGFLITLQREKIVPFTTPQQETLVETTTVPQNLIERLECKVANYNVTKEEVLGIDGRRITLLNKRNEAWTFLVTATFMFTNRTSDDVPFEKVDVVMKSVTIPGGLTEQVELYPPSFNTTSYRTVYVKMLVEPEKKECEVDMSTIPRERVLTKTITKEITYHVPVIERRSIWNLLFEEMMDDTKGKI